MLQAAGGYRAVEDALAAQHCVILDGGIATQLPHRHGQDNEELWGIETLASSPEEVRDMHRSYADAGADVISTNTWALPTLLKGGGYVNPSQGEPVHWMEVARRGVRLAREAAARPDGNQDCAVALTLNGDLDSGDSGEAVTLLMRALSDDPPDLILVETLSVLHSTLYDVVEALLETSIPLWLSFRRCRHGLCGVYGQHWGGPEGDAFGRAARRFEEMGVAALLVNCVPPDHVDGVVSHLRDFTDLPLGVYPNLGYYTNAGWRSETEIGGAEYAEMALRWRAEGAQIIGGCCGTRPEHILAAHDALNGTLRGRQRHEEAPLTGIDSPLPEREEPTWRSRRGRRLFPLDFPRLGHPRDRDLVIPGSFLMWRYLFEEQVGAHQRCLDMGSGTGLQTVQLALNGAAHVHAIDVDERAITDTLESAFENGVADRVSVEVGDLYPWVPEERYELIVGCLPQMPIDPLSQLSSHRPTDYWGRGLVDQVIAKIPRAIAPEGHALLALTSLLSRERTGARLAEAGLTGEVVAWELQELPAGYRENLDHLRTVQSSSDGYMLRVGDHDVLVCYLLELRHDTGAGGGISFPWDAR
jgi:S-methylmethionine-dependent homocysteine/selenocysteine methylase/SAM-dependent methyltransferase